MIDGRLLRATLPKASASATHSQRKKKTTSAAGTARSKRHRSSDFVDFKVQTFNENAILKVKVENISNIMNYDYRQSDEIFTGRGVQMNKTSMLKNEDE